MVLFKRDLLRKVEHNFCSHLGGGSAEGIGDQRFIHITIHVQLDIQFLVDYILDVGADLYVDVTIS
jgi:hypothetical protein